MKMRNLVLTLTLGMTIATQAKNLDSYRAQSAKLKSEGKAASEVQKTVSALRTKLGTSGLQVNPAVLSFDLSKISSPTRVSYNTYFKSILQESLNRLSQEGKYQSPVAIDDTVSMEKLLYAKENVKRANCMAGFLGTGEKAQSIDSFLGSFLALMKESKAKKIDGSAASPETTAAFLKLLTPEVARTGALEVLGDLIGVQVTDGVVKELLLLKKDAANPNKKPLQLTLSMMITARTGEDSSYLEAQKCLLDFLEEQSAVLQMRLRLMDDTVLADKMNQYQVRLEKIAKKIQEFEHGYDQSDAGLKRGVELAEKWKAEQVRKDPRAQYLKKLAIFLEGRTFNSNQAGAKKEGWTSSKNNHLGIIESAKQSWQDGRAYVENEVKDNREEREFINSRLNRVHGVLELMAPKYRESKAVNELLAKLKVSQVNQLIDLLLQLRGNDIVTDYDFTDVTEQMYKASVANQAGVDADVNIASADSINYGLQYKQIAQLGRVLDEERMLREQRQADLNQINSQPRP